jgi:hypothetical protein
MPGQRLRSSVLGGSSRVDGDPASNTDIMFANHQHRGSPTDGSILYGPYFIFDANGKVRKLAVDGNGVATWNLV